MIIIELKRYWFSIKKDRELPIGISMGCGITAYNLEDAKKILSEQIFNNEPFQIEDVKENIDISTLDKGHVLLNMLPPNRRGVWFPMGYD